jgi:hypothetical protein
VKTRIFALLIILAFGVARLHFEERLTEEHRAAFFHGGKLDLDMRQRLGQGGFIAALSGFRALVADVLWIQAHSAWERTEWGRMKLLFDTVTSLQPRCLMFWDMAAWHMAYNASVAAYEDKNQPREALRVRAQREYFRIGEQFLLDGIKNNPERPQLYDRLGFLYRDKFKDMCKASEYYEKCAQLPGAPHYAKRFAAFWLAECPGHEREAYEKLVALYKMGPDEHVPTLLTKLHEMEEKLSVPASERIYSPRQP